MNTLQYWNFLTQSIEIVLNQLDHILKKLFPINHYEKYFSDFHISDLIKQDLEFLMQKINALTWMF